MRTLAFTLSEGEASHSRVLNRGTRDDLGLNRITATAGQE